MEESKLKEETQSKPEVGHPEKSQGDQIEKQSNTRNLLAYSLYKYYGGSDISEHFHTFSFWK